MEPKDVMGPYDGGPRLVIVCGMPGSGKTTHARLVAESMSAVRFCPDEWMDALSLDLYDEVRREGIETLQWKIGQELLARGFTIVIEWGTWGRLERDRLRTEASALGAAVELHYLSASVDVLFERIQLRARETPPIEREAVVRWAQILQVPTAEEAALYDRFLAFSTDVVEDF
jgi:predicted kinase